jgi:GNAT superfamily N-acetyltransferase
MITFRQAIAAKDHSTLIKLQKHCLPNDKPYSAAGWYWIGYEDNKPVAFCVLAPSRRWADTVYLARAGVIETHRGQGLQKRMIQIRNAYAKRKGYTWAVTDTTDNPASSNSLISKGFKLFTPSCPWGYSSSLYWRKRL